MPRRIDAPEGLKRCRRDGLERSRVRLVCDCDEQYRDCTWNVIFAYASRRLVNVSKEPPHAENVFLRR
jgi:hypothetical protein